MNRNPHPRFFCLLLMIILLVPSAVFAQNVDDMSAEELTAHIISLARMLEEKQSETSSVAADESASDNCSIIFNDKTYVGTYIGDTKNGVPHGEGRFEGTCNQKKLTYDGHWTHGKMSGFGNLECEEYTLHFNNSEGIFDRIGPFKGEMINGIPNGYGVFSSINSEGTPWTYTGEWKDGIFHGQGKSVWSDESSTSQIGTYVKGVFSPTLSDFLVMISGADSFSISENSKSFINKYYDYFYKERKNTIGKWKPSFSNDGSIQPSSKTIILGSTTSIPAHLVHKAFYIREFKKKPSLYDHRFLHIADAYVIQAISFELGASTFEQILFETNSGNIFFGFLQGSSNIVEGMRIEAHVLPLDYATYEDVSTGETWAVFCAIAADIKEAYDTLQAGSNGSDVLKMKYRLQELGYFNAGASLSDSYNSTCAERVRQFQSVNNLLVTGIADHATLNLLYSSQAKRKP